MGLSGRLQLNLTSEAEAEAEAEIILMRPHG